MQLEDAIKVYEKGWKLQYFEYDTKPKEVLKNTENLLKKLGIEFSKKCTSNIKLDQSLNQIEDEINSLNMQINNLSQDVINLEEEIKQFKENIESMQNLKDIDVNLENLYSLKYMRFRYGKISKTNYNKLLEDIQNMNVINFKINEDENFVWIIYFTTDEYSSEIDSYYNVMKFERIWISQDLQGKPNEILENIQNRISENEKNIEIKRIKLEQIIKEKEPTLINYYRQLQIYTKIENVKRYMAHDKNYDFYIIGWIPKEEVIKMQPMLKQEEDIKYVIKSHDEVATNPPTHLKNNKLFKKFEPIIQMYGMPNYEEIDPTKFVAITAFLMFGFMFGDVGQGAIIAILGIIMSKRKSSLGPVFVAGGISAVIFGFLYGSVFGKENIIPSILIRPMENIQSMLILGLSFGVILILMAMILNICNGIKNKDLKKTFFSENGLAGLIFYSTIIIAVVYYFIKGKMIVSAGILAAIIIIQLLIILFKNKLEELFLRKKEKSKSSIIEQAFELIETLLSFASNTISFIRLAAFAINHVGLCMAVYILSNMLSGIGNIAIAILGNVLVIVLEGLIVAIQVLRLEYYELFSRFYSGDGKEYKPIKDEIAD